MSDMPQLLVLLKELDDQLVTCMRCGMCQAVCPLYATTGRETDVARGKIALLEGLAHKLIEDAQGVQDRLHSCLLCGACAASCPSGVKTLEIFLKARAVLATYSGLSPAKKLIFKGLLTRPKLFNKLLSLAASFQGLALKPASELLGSSCGRFGLPGLAGRHIIPLAQKPFLATVGGVDAPKGKSGVKVAFYPGCVVDKIFPQVGLASLKALEHHGVAVYLPKDQACCGIPALSAGDRPTFEKLVAANLEMFGAAGVFDYLVTPCATCASTIKKLWPTMTTGLSLASRKRIGELAAKTMDITAFLVDKVGLVAPATQNESATAVTCHDPCHLKKSLGVSEQPRTLLSLNPAYRLVEMADADACCGCGGSFTLQHYELSKQIGGRKRDNILASSAEIVAAACPACMLQLTDMLSQAGARVAVKHPVELYAETLD